jgi:hypothetical protein
LTPPILPTVKNVIDTTNFDDYPAETEPAPPDFEDPNFENF